LATTYLPHSNAGFGNARHQFEADNYGSTSIAEIAVFAKKNGIPEKKKASANESALPRMFCPPLICDQPWVFFRRVSRRQEKEYLAAFPAGSNAASAPQESV